jgi:hypothetical protein
MGRKGPTVATRMDWRKISGAWATFLRVPCRVIKIIEKADMPCRISLMHNGGGFVHRFLHYLLYF